MAKRFRCPSRKRRVAGSIPGGYIYFHFEFFAYFPSFQVGGALANEIKHEHSPVVIVVLDPRHDVSYKALYIHSRSFNVLPDFSYIYITNT